MRNLLVISNHNPEFWDQSQKEGWDKIEFMQFPNVSPQKDMEAIINCEIVEIVDKINSFYRECLRLGAKGFVNLQGDFSLCYLVYQLMPSVNFIFPTTERVVEERPNGEKVSRFKFVRWR